MIRISFLLPCFKVEKYIQACLDSIYKIDLPEDEFEVLCFDDCSPDRTVEILERNTQIHSNLHIIRAKENVGCGGGRNVLLKEAKGKYIWFIDPDDLIDPKVVKPMLEQVEKNTLDALMFNYTDISEDQKSLGTGSYFQDTEIMNGLDFTDHVFGHGIVNHMGYVVRFLVRRDYVLDIGLLFPEKMAFQDTVWMPKLILNSKRIQASQHMAYYYWHHETSAMGAFDKSYPAKSIYTRSITVTKLLLDFAEELEQKRQEDIRYSEYAKVFHDFAQSYYLNRLPIYLSRTKRNERKAFYNILRTNGVPDQVAQLANIPTRLVLLPHVGYTFCNIIAIGYSFTHKNK